MTERKHTPTPWRVGRGPNGEVEIWGRTSMNASPIVASMEHGPRELNALTIVRAVNGIALASPPAMGEDVAEFVRRLGNGLNPRNGSINVSVPAFQLYMETQLRALLSRIEAAGGGWRPIEAAKKDRTSYLLKLKDRIPNERADLRLWDGLQFVGHHHGLAEDGFDIGWSFSAPVGHGGFPDEWFQGYRPLPSPQDQP